MVVFILKRISFLIIALFLIISLTGCGSSVQGSIKDYKDVDVAAIVGDQEITIGELRFLYEDEEILKNIEEIVRLELVLQEVKRMNLDISEDRDLQKEAMLSLPLSSEEDPIWASMRLFVESQVEKLEMKTEEYYKEYVEIRSEQIAYINAYTREMIGIPDADNEDDLNEYNDKVNDFLNELMKEHEKEIEILIQ